MVLCRYILIYIGLQWFNHCMWPESKCTWTMGSAHDWNFRCRRKPFNGILNPIQDPYNDPTITAPITPEQVYTIYQTQFDTQYAGNKAPFGIYTHPVWLVPSSASSTAPIPNGAAKLAAVQKFIAYAMAKPNVWMVTHQQLIAYMQNPVSASQLASQPYMQCLQSPLPPTNICNGLGSVIAPVCGGLPSGTFQSCFGCPSEYPSLSNPAPTGYKCTIPATCNSLFWDPATCTCLCNAVGCAFNDTSRPVNLDPNSINSLAAGGGGVVNINGTYVNGTTASRNGARVAGLTGLVGLALAAMALFTV